MYVGPQFLWQLPLKEARKHSIFNMATSGGMDAEYIGKCIKIVKDSLAVSSSLILRRPRSVAVPSLPRGREAKGPRATSDV